MVAAEDRENRADADVDVDVAGAVERIEDDDVFPELAIALDDHGIFVFFRRHDGHVAAVAQKLQQRLIRDDVELLDLLALDVRFARDADDAGQSRAANLSRDDLGGQRDSGQQPGELAAGARMVSALHLQDVLLDGQKLSVRLVHGSSC